MHATVISSVEAGGHARRNWPGLDCVHLAALTRELKSFSIYRPFNRDAREATGNDPIRPNDAGGGLGTMPLSELASRFARAAFG
jgi:hypothetical protein